MHTVMEPKGLRFSTFIELLLLSDGPLQTSETRLISENPNGGKYRILIRMVGRGLNKAQDPSLTL